jgi:transposase
MSFPTRRAARYGAPCKTNQKHDAQAEQYCWTMQAHIETNLRTGRARTLPLDLRERILASYDNEEGNRQEIADRYHVSLGMVKKLLRQRLHTGDIAARHHRSGRKPIILPSHRRQMQLLLSQKWDMTLKELREALDLQCSLPAIHSALEKMGLTFRMRHPAVDERGGKSLRPIVRAEAPEAHAA